MLEVGSIPPIHLVQKLCRNCLESVPIFLCQFLCLVARLRQYLANILRGYYLRRYFLGPTTKKERHLRPASTLSYLPPHAHWECARASAQQPQWQSGSGGGSAAAGRWRWALQQQGSGNSTVKAIAWRQWWQRQLGGGVQLGSAVAARRHLGMAAAAITTAVLPPCCHRALLQWQRRHW